MFASRPDEMCPPDERGRPGRGDHRPITLTIQSMVRRQHGEGMASLGLGAVGRSMSREEEQKQDREGQGPMLKSV